MRFQLLAIVTGVVGLVLHYVGVSAAVPAVTTALLLFIGVDVYGLLTGQLKLSPFAFLPVLPALFVRPWPVGLLWGFVVIGSVDSVISAVMVWSSYRRRRSSAATALLEMQLRPRNLPKSVFFWSLLAAHVGGLSLGMLGLLIYTDPLGVYYSPYLAVPYILMSLYVFVILCVLLYRAWCAIQDGHARATPARAVGFLFIPIYNLYWIFQAVWGFARDYNALVERRALEVRKLPESVFLACCISLAIYWIPWTRAVPVLAVLVLMPILAWKTCDAVNALPRVIWSREGRMSEQPN